MADGVRIESADWTDPTVLDVLLGIGFAPQERIPSIYQQLSARGALQLVWTVTDGVPRSAVIVRPEEDQPGLQLVPCWAERPGSEGDQHDSGDVLAMQASVEAIRQQYNRAHLWSNVRWPGRDDWAEVLTRCGFDQRSNRQLWSVDCREVCRPAEKPSGLMLREVNATAAVSDAELLAAVDMVHNDTLDPLDRLRLKTPAQFIRTLSKTTDPSESVMWFTAHANGQLAGYLCCVRSGEELWVYDVGVVPAHRGRGLGALLVQHGLRRMVCDETEVAYAFIDTVNRASQKTHQNCGFVSQSAGETVWHAVPSRS